MCLWILLGIISFSGLIPVHEAQISELSKSPYGGSGGTYIETLWSRQRPQTTSSGSRRAQQRVVNPRNFQSFARTNRPYNSVESQSGLDQPWSAQNAPRGNGAAAEASMLKTEAAPQTTVTYGRLLPEITQSGQVGVVSRYPADTMRFSNKNNRRSRYRFLPDGSLVDYGVSTRRMSQYVPPVTRAIRPTVAQPRPTKVAITRPVTVQTRPRQTTKTATAQKLMTTVSRTRTSPAPKMTTERPVIKPVENIQPSAIWTRPASAVTGVAIHVPLTRPVTPKPRPRIPVDDAAMSPSGVILDDPWKPEVKTESQTKYYTQTRTQTYSMTQPRTTTTTTTTTTTPVPPTTTTEKPRKTMWNGPDAVNITYGDEKHVCPPSRARWQDYTVYLETKPRLCMIQITWNARYKREAIYHNSWWGVDVEWIYKTVYDPEVKFVDLHGWHG